MARAWEPRAARLLRSRCLPRYLKVASPDGKLPRDGLTEALVLAQSAGEKLPQDGLTKALDLAQSAEEKPPRAGLTEALDPAQQAQPVQPAAQALACVGAWPSDRPLREAKGDGHRPADPVSFPPGRRSDREASSGSWRFRFRCSC